MAMGLLRNMATAAIEGLRAPSTREGLPGCCGGPFHGRGALNRTIALRCSLPGAFGRREAGRRGPDGQPACLKFSA